MIQKKNPLNDPEQWDASQEPPYFDVKRFQRRIDEAIGKSKDRHSIIKLVWAPTVWSRYFGESMPDYWYARYMRKGKFEYKLVPRWIFVQRMEPEQYAEAWESERYIREDGEVFDRGPVPKEMYIFRMACAKHTELRNELGVPHCCANWETSENNYQRCWGEYRDPSEIDFAAITESYKAMEREPYFDKYAPVSSEQLDFIQKQARHEYLRVIQERDEKLKRIVDDQIDLWGYRVFNEDPSVAHHGNKHFPHMEQLKSGIWAPRAELTKNEDINAG